MKKIRLLLFLLGLVTVTVHAQTRTGKQSQPISANQEKMNAVTSCPELQSQLTKMFGENFSIDDSKVKSQLERNIADQQASICVKKGSLFALYGKEYTKHLNEISNSSTKTNN